MWRPDLRAKVLAQELESAFVYGGHQIGLAVRQQQFEYAVAQCIEIPARLAEEAVERTIVLETGELAGLNDARH